MTHIEEEIEDDLRRQKLEQFWKENGSWIIICAILAVIFTGALTWWRQHEYKQNLTQTAALLEVLRENDTKALGEFALKSDKDHGAIALFTAAALHSQRSQDAEAVTLYRKIDGTSGLDSTYRDLAKLLRVSKSLGAEDPAQLHKDLAPLTAKSTWRYSALELQALLYARENKMKEAAEVLTRLTQDGGAPNDVRMRASTLRELYMGSATAK